jgi:uncharacterized protein DUF2330
MHMRPPRFAALALPLKLLAPAALALVALIGQALPAAACGSLVAPNGAVRLQRATTLVAWHDGVERYLTSFSYQGDVDSIGYIVPLPAEPIKPVEEGGAWTLQRLQRESHPIPPNVRFGAAAGTSAADKATVLQQVKIEALNISVVKGSGDAGTEWATENGFTLDIPTRVHLRNYAKTTPFFMAAKYDTAEARARKQISGDGTPVLVTMRTPHLWVPIEILALEDQRAQADLFLLTDNPVYTSDAAALVGQSSVGTEIAGAPGFKLSFQERMNETLYRDLSTDRNMSWVRPDSWFTYLELNAPEQQPAYDLGLGASGVIRTAPYGTAPMDVVDRAEGGGLSTVLPRLPLGTPGIALSLLLLTGILVAITLLIRAARRSPATPANKQE